MFASDKDAIHKWCLIRPDQAKKHMYSLKQMAGLSHHASSYKHLRPSYILKIERMVTEVMCVIEEEYINPLVLIFTNHIYKT